MNSITYAQALKTVIAGYLAQLVAGSADKPRCACGVYAPLAKKTWPNHPIDKTTLSQIPGYVKLLGIIADAPETTDAEQLIIKYALERIREYIALLTDIEPAGRHIFHTYPLPVRLMIGHAVGAGMVLSTETRDGGYREGLHLFTVLTGTEDQIRSIAELDHARLPASMRRGHLWLACGVVGSIYRRENEIFDLVIEYVRAASKIYCTRWERRAQDAGYKNFRAKIFAPVELSAE